MSQASFVHMTKSLIILSANTTLLVLSHARYIQNICNQNSIVIIHSIRFLYCDFTMVCFMPRGLFLYPAGYYVIPSVQNLYLRVRLSICPSVDPFVVLNILIS